MESSCFICGLVISSSSGERGLAQSEFKSLRRLMLLICKSFNATAIKWKDWSFLWTLPRHKSICCVKCFRLLEGVETVLEKMADVQRELTARLNQIENLVVISEELPVENSWWEWSCFEFRKRVISNKEVTCSKDEAPGKIKEEPDNGGEEDDPQEEEDNCPSPAQQEDWSADDGVMDVDPPEYSEYPRNGAAGQKISASEAEPEFPSGESVTVPELLPLPQRRPRKRKIIVVADEDHPEEDHEGGAMKPRLFSGEDNPRKEFPGEDNRLQQRLNGRGSWNPFVIATKEADILLYKYGTFVQKTYTHLICKAHLCNFQTEFDYFSSFQVMRAHIEDNHRSRRHRQRTLHPCLLCPTQCQNQAEFRQHADATHPSIAPKGARVMCECCLANISSRSSRVHQFSHKNAEEKALAREVGDGNARCFERKTREILEKGYLCDWENCPAAFKTAQLLKRHKRSHLAVEERPDTAVCSECGVWVLKPSLDSHIKRLHRPDLVETFLSCPLCDKRFLPKDKPLLESHLRRHRGEKPFLCAECGAAFVSRAGVQGHMKQVHSAVENPCEWCDKVFFKRGSLSAHLRRRHPDAPPRNGQVGRRKRAGFYFDEAAKRPRKEELIGPVQKYPCPLCEVVCKYKFTLKKHLRLHSSNKGGSSSLLRNNGPFYG